MSKAQRYKQQQKDKKQAAANKNTTPKLAEPTQPKTLRERQAENKAALAKHQASMTRLKAFEDKLHPKPAGEAAEPQPEKSALQDMFFDGGNLSKDQGRTSHIPLQKESPATAVRSVTHPIAEGGHEKNTAIKSI